MKRLVRAPLNTFLAGLLASLPLFLTFVMLGWVANLIKKFLGPESIIGGFFSAIGLQMVEDEWKAYLLGVLVLLSAVFALGLVVQTSLRRHVRSFVDRSIKRLPIIGSLYDATDRFIGMFDRKQQTELTAMSPVWCFFGGEGGTAVLALMPNPNPIQLGGKAYLTVLVPTAPIPIGGGLLYVPAEWVKPADMGVEQLSSIYLSMGLTQAAPQPRT